MHRFRATRPFVLEGCPAGFGAQRPSAPSVAVVRDPAMRSGRPRYSSAPLDVYGRDPRNNNSGNDPRVSGSMPSLCRPRHLLPRFWHAKRGLPVLLLTRDTARSAPRILFSLRPLCPGVEKATRLSSARTRPYSRLENAVAVRGMHRSRDRNLFQKRPVPVAPEKDYDRAIDAFRELRQRFPNGNKASTRTGKPRGFLYARAKRTKRKKDSRSRSRSILRQQKYRQHSIGVPEPRKKMARPAKQGRTTRNSRIVSGIIITRISPVHV